MSTAILPLAITGGTARLVIDGDYHATLRALVAGARWRCLCSIFLVDLAPARDDALLVDGVLLALEEARWRGVDARLLVGGSRTNLEMAEMADVARARAAQLGVPCRWLTSTPVRGSHVKLVVADDTILTGSHNWSPGAFGTQTQDSVLVESADLAAWGAAQFRRQWTRAGEA